MVRAGSMTQVMCMLLKYHEAWIHVKRGLRVRRKEV